MVPYGSHKDLDGAWRHGIVIKETRDGREQKLYGKYRIIGSSAADNGGGGSIDYAAAKAGIDGMVMYLCKTYAREGILTNVIHPAVIETDLLKARYSKEEDKNCGTARAAVDTGIDGGGLHVGTAHGIVVRQPQVAGAKLTRRGGEELCDLARGHIHRTIPSV